MVDPLNIFKQHQHWLPLGKTREATLQHRKGQFPLPLRTEVRLRIALNRRDDPERTGDNKAIATQHRLQSAVRHLLGMSLALPTGHLTQCITTDWTNGSPHNGRSYRNYPNACHDR